MNRTININTSSEKSALISDKWIVGTGLSTDSLYVVHTSGPIMIIEYPIHTDSDEKDVPECTIYVTGEINPTIFNRLITEAWELVAIYKEKLQNFKDAFTTE